jgi:hypothetical protein
MNANSLLRAASLLAMMLNVVTAQVRQNPNPVVLKHWTALYWQPQAADAAAASFPASANPRVFAQYKDWGNRFEGTLNPSRALRKYELLGFYAYRENFPLSDGVNLRVRFFLPENEPAYIEARELIVYSLYKMRPKDASILKVPGGWSEFEGWPVSDVLKPVGISADNLGVIVRLKSNAEYATDLAPAILLSSVQPPPVAIHEYVLFLTVYRKLSNIDYYVRGSSGYSRSYKYKGKERDRSVEGGTVIPIRFSAQQFPAGPATIHVRGFYADDTTGLPLDITYDFYHKPL